VEATLRPNRNIVAISKIDGKLLSSSGSFKNNTVIKMMTANVIETARLKSRNHVGTGNNNNPSINTIATASMMSLRPASTSRILLPFFALGVWCRVRAGVRHALGVLPGVAGVFGVIPHLA
jgi:hypothetical protein